MAVAIAATILSFSAVDPLAAKLLCPYLAWVCYATALNAWIYANNPPPKKE